MSEVRRDGYNYHNTYVESVEWQRDKAYARAEKAERERDEAVTTASKLLNIEICGGCLLGEAGKHLHLSDEDNEQLGDSLLTRALAAEARAEKAERERDEDRRREYGYSQQTVDALAGERDRLRARAEKAEAEVERLRKLLSLDPNGAELARIYDGWTEQKARAEKAERERDEARREINDAWLMIENGWDDNIESRAEWEKRYRKNFNDGGSGPLGMAIHAAGYKRETKAEARAETLAAALREIQEGKGPFDRDNHKFACNVIESMKAIAALALADGEEK